MDYRFVTDTENPYVEVGLLDYSLLATPLLNKGMSFSEKERSDFHLHGLIPQEITTLETQTVRTYNRLKSKCSLLEKYIFLRDIQDSNETLFYNLLSKHIEECLPIIYTPGVGEGCSYFSHIYRRPRGLFLSYPLKDKIEEILSHPKFNDTEIIVVSDGERILGLGDLGAGGMGIPIGKLSLYTTCAGIHPKATLPILLDTGTDNTELLNDPLYIGWRHQRIRGKEYDDFIETFIHAIKKRFPHVLLQWEDFAKQSANMLLERYRHELCSFNDDIQGTAAVTAGALFSAIQAAKTKLQDQKIVILGGGSAGCGISDLLVKAMIKEGISETEALQKFFLIGRYGLVFNDMTHLLPFQKPFAKQRSDVHHWTVTNKEQISLLDVIRNVHPTLLIGVSAQPGTFTEEIVREMAAHVNNPIIFPLSNPTTQSEATPKDLLQWTNGKAIIGTGSPFGSVIKNGKSFRIDQVNNAYIFPGLGLGIIATKAKTVTDSMFLAAAEILGSLTPIKTNAESNLLPPFTHIREISFQIAMAVGKTAIEEGLSDCSLHELEHRIQKNIWEPKYWPYFKI